MTLTEIFQRLLWSPVPPPLSGDMEAYKFYIELHLELLCGQCGTSRDLLRHRAPDEDECPYGIWQERRARLAMNSGWHVDPSSSHAYCPSCTAKKGLTIRRIE